MSLLPFEFDHANHIYKSPGYYVLSTSDVLELNCFYDYGSVPKMVLANAASRGTEIHKAIEWFETDGEPPDMPEEIEDYFNGWMKFRTRYEFEPIGEMEKRMVYQFGEKDYAIGATVDARGLLNGKPYVVDVKTNAKQSGKALKQKLLCWRMQTQSYVEATNLDEDWWKAVKGNSAPGRAIVQLSKEGEYTFHDFSAFDDSESWAAAVHVAQLKLRNGYDQK